jgi:hypothetical protein
LGHTKISVLDFLEPAEADAAGFERERFSATAREKLRNALEFVETFSQAYFHPSFEHSLQPLISSLRTNSNLWNKFDDAFLLFRISMMLQYYLDFTAAVLGFARFGLRPRCCAKPSPPLQNLGAPSKTLLGIVLLS